MLRKKVKKYLLISGISFAIGILGIIFVSTLIEEVVRAIAGEEANKQIVQSDLDGLPAWITVEMVQAAIDMMNETGYPASVVLGQMILEAGADGSELANPPYYNCLGQKAHCYKESGTVVMRTEEAWGTVTAEFSTFANYVDCMLAWGNKFTRQPYVDNVIACKRDPVTGHYDADSFITALWKSGYATDPAYVSKVIAVMKGRNLYRFNYMTSADLENGLGEIGTGMFTHPCPGMTYQSSYFGEIREFETGGHKGNDYAAPAGTPTLAAADGTVTVAGWSDSAGNWVVIDHGNGLTTKYMHHSRLLVKTGDTVKKGQQIGEVGSTGQSTGNHLHFQVEENGVPVNPDKYLKGEGNERE